VSFWKIDNKSGHIAYLISTCLARLPNGLPHNILHGLSEETPYHLFSTLIWKCLLQNCKLFLASFNMLPQLLDSPSFVPLFDLVPIGSFLNAKQMA
jgi:hypothetical protein